VLVRRAVTYLQSIRAETAAVEEVGHDPTESIAVRDALARLEPTDRAILSLSHFEGLSYAEISQALEIPAGTVASRLHAARDAFRREWNR
jgi:RNA polymerase sigma-70 factor, ECF subfamily